MADNRAKYSYTRRESLNDGRGPKWLFWKRRRTLMAVMAFFGFALIYANLVDLSVAILAMVKGHSSGMGEFGWNPIIEGLVLSSFFYGYASTQFLGGYMASKVGGVKFFGLGVGLPAILAIFTQYVARAHYGALMALRIAEGIIQGICYPSIHAVWAYWVPPLERTGLIAFSYSGAYCGTALAMILSGILAKYFAWPIIFLSFGSVGAVWYGFWLAFFYATPSTDPYITRSELRYLKFHIDVSHEPLKHPWKEIFTSSPVYALMITHFAINWGAYTLLTELPIYIQDVMKFDIANAGLLSSMPYIVSFFTMQFTGVVADYILVRDLISVTKMRKMFIAAGCFIEGAFLFFVGFTKSAISALILLTFAMMGEALLKPNYFVNHLDIAPKHASVLMGICNTIATIPGIISPTLTGYLTPNKSRKEWRTIFMIAGSLYWFAAFVYIIFGNAELQKWALKDESDDVESSEERE